MPTLPEPTAPRPGAHRVPVHRSERSPPVPRVLDRADPNINTPVRATTISPLQALALLNDRFMIQQSRASPAASKPSAATPARQIDDAYRFAFGRPPRSEERVALTGYVGKHGLANACRFAI